MIAPAELKAPPGPASCSGGQVRGRGRDRSAVGGRSAIGGEVGTSGIQEDVHQVRSVIHLATRAAGSWSPDSTSGADQVRTTWTRWLHLAPWASSMPAPACYIWQDRGLGQLLQQVTSGGRLGAGGPGTGFAKVATKIQWPLRAKQGGRDPLSCFLQFPVCKAAAIPGLKTV